MLIWAFLAGCISIVPVFIIGSWWEGNGFKQEGDNFYLAFYSFVVIALTEEFCKFIFVKRILRKSYVDEPYDAILYSVVVSMGFAFVENLLYVSGGGIGVGILRAFTAVPAHATFGAIMGFFLGNAKFKNRKTLNTLLALAGAVIMHGFYDYFLFIKNIPLIQLGALVSLITGVLITMRAIRIHNHQSPYKIL